VKRSSARTSKPKLKQKKSRSGTLGARKALGAIPRPSVAAASAHSNRLLFVGGLLLLVLAVSEGLLLTLSVRSLRLSA